MSFKMTPSTSGKKLGSNKLVLGFAALAATAIIGASGVAAAQTASAQMGSGYGGGSGNTANVNFDLDVSGDNNVINIILNLFR
jgi:hypothetical protein